MRWSVFGETFVTRLVIMDPLGAAPIFLTLTSSLDGPARRRAALRATAAALVLVLVFGVAGDVLLRYLDVSIDSLSIAGGLLLLLLALEILRGVDFPVGPGGDVALVPLASPLVAGPGAIATAVVLARENPSTGGRVAVVAGIVAAVLAVGLSLVAAERLARSVPHAVLDFATHVIGLLLAAIGVELIVSGVRGAVG